MKILRSHSVSIKQIAHFLPHISLIRCRLIMFGKYRERCFGRPDESSTPGLKFNGFIWDSFRYHPCIFALTFNDPLRDFAEQTLRPIIHAFSEFFRPAVLRALIPLQIFRWYLLKFVQLLFLIIVLTSRERSIFFASVENWHLLGWLFLLILRLLLQQIPLSVISNPTFLIFLFKKLFLRMILSKRLFF